MKRAALAIAGFTILVGCQQREAANVPRATLSPPFDLQRLIRQVHFAYRPEGTDLVGGHSTYQVRVAPDGSFSVQPIHQPATGPALPHALAPVHGGLARLSSRAGALAGHEPAVATTDDGAVRIRRGPITETLRNTDDGVEQSWTFPERPAAGGDLDLRVALDGYRYDGITKNGLHFRDPDGELGLRYGLATWIDAHGVRTPIEPRWNGTEIALTVPADLLATSAYPAVLDPLITGEYATDTPVLGTPVGTQANPAIADDGTNSFVVWEDNRSGITQLWAARTHGTTILDPSGILISTPIGPAAYNPAVAFDGTHYTVAWTDTSSNVRVMSRQVNTDGTLVTSYVLPVTSPLQMSAIGKPSIAFDGTRYLVVWQDKLADASGNIVGARLTTAGDLEDPSAPIVISNVAGAQTKPSVASTGSGGFFVVWTDARSGTDAIFGAKVTTGGTVQNGGPGVGLTISSGAQARREPQIASNGTIYLVTWSDLRSGNADIWGVRIQGTALLNTEMVLCQQNGDQTAPVLGFGGAKFLVAWADTRNGSLPEAYFSRVTATQNAFSVLDVGGLQLTSGANSHLGGVIYRAGNFGVAHDSQPTTARHVYSSRVDGATGNVLDSSPGFLVPQGANQQSNAVAASDGTNFFIAWEDRRGAGNANLYGTILKPDGTLLNPGSPTITLVTEAKQQSNLEVAWNGTNYLAVWQDQRIQFATGKSNVYGRRVSAAGSALGTADGFRIDNDAVGVGDSLPTVASDGTNWFVAWATDDGAGACSASTCNIRGAVVNANGTVNTPIDVIAAAAVQSGPKLAFNGTNYLLIWNDTRNGALGETWAARLDTTGTPLASAAIINFLMQSGWNLAANGSTFLVTYQSLVTPSRVLGRVVDASTLVAGTDKIIADVGSDSASNPRPVFDGTSYVVVWTNLIKPQARVARASTVGDPLDSPSLSLPATLYNVFPTRIATDKHGRSLIVYDAFDSTSGIGARRIHGSFFLEQTNGQTCNNAGECTSGFCVGGYCCDSACTSGSNNVAATTCGGATPGTCTVTACSAGFLDCSGGYANGCETSSNNTSNCGGCGNVCQTAHANGPVTCGAGVCQFTCLTGYANCSDPTTQHLAGCNTDTKLQGNCGGCGVTCTAPTCSVNPVCDGTSGNGVCKAENNALCDHPACQLAADVNYASCLNNSTYPWKDTDGDGFNDIQETQGYIDTNCNGTLDAADYQFPTETKHVFSSVTHTGTGIGQIFPTVTNPTQTVAATTVEVTIASTGAIGAATFTYKIGGGAASAAQLIRPVVDITGNNRLLFYISSYISGDIYSYSTSMATAAPVADVNVPNVYVQYDYMDFDAAGAACVTDADCLSGQPNAVCHAGFCNHDHAPADPLFRLVRDAYTARGLRLYIDPIHNAVPHATVLTFAKAGDTGALANGPLTICAGADVVSGALTGGAVNFHDVKNRNTYGGPFAANRKSVYRYSIFAHLNTCLTDNTLATVGNCTQCPTNRSTPSGQPTAGTSGTSELPGNDFMVTMAASFNNPLGSVQRNPFSEGGVFMHELGHTLGLHHAGDVGSPVDAPNYLSVMNGKYVFSGIQSSSAAGSTVSVEANRRLDYAQHRLRTLNEGSLTAADGVSVLSTGYTGIVRFTGGSGLGAEAGPIDWDGSGTPICSVDLNGQSGGAEIMPGFADGPHQATGGACTSSVNCAAPLPTCDLTNLVCVGTCATSADCRVNAVRQQIHDLIDPTFDPHEPCIAGSCNSMMYPFQCFAWTLTDAPPPPELKVYAEPSPTIAAAHHDLFPSVNATIDVRPGCATNWIALAGPGNVPVAILGSQDVDATLIDVLSLRLGAASAASTSLSDVNGDGRTDMTANFPMASVALQPSATTATVRGYFASSQLFQGSDAITIVPSPGPVVTLHNDGTGFSRSIIGTLNGSWVNYSLADCVDAATDRCNNSLLPNSAGSITKIVMDEHESPPDMEILSPSTFRLARDADGPDGRVYIVYFTLSDASGNATATTCQIQAKEQNNPNSIWSGQVDCVGTCP